MEIFTAIGEKNNTDLVAKLYQKMCGECLASPPPADWDAVNNLTSK
jgi:hypothetical protein